MKKNKEKDSAKETLQKIEKASAWAKLLFALMQAAAAVLFVLLMIAALKSCGVKLSDVFQNK